MVSNANFNCTLCKAKHVESRRNSMKGCSKPLDRSIAKWKDKIFFYRCPSNFYSSLVADLMGHARHLENGLLPYQGGLFDQPAKLIELYNFINSLRLDDEVARLKKEAQEYKKWPKKT